MNATIEAATDLSVKEIEDIAKDITEVNRDTTEVSEEIHNISDSVSAPSDLSERLTKLVGGCKT